MKLYLGLGLILLLGLAFWYHGNSNYQSGVNAERVRWQDQTKKRDDEIQRLQSELLSRRNRAENEISKEAPKHAERKAGVLKVASDCVIPIDILRLHAEAGVYQGKQ